MGKYSLVYLQSAKKDLIEVMRYITENLKNPTAAKNLAGKIKKALETAGIYPYSNPLYYPLNSLKYEYRKIIIDNYIVFYHVMEEEKYIIISRVIYGKRNLMRRLK